MGESSQELAQSCIAALLQSASISEILSSKYAYLDDKEETSSIKREVIPKWPVLEDALFEWEQRYEQASLTVNADVLRTKATELWNKLPQYEGIPTPKWSNGLLDRFKRRRGLKQRIHHGEAGSADQSENVQQIMTVSREGWRDTRLYLAERISRYSEPWLKRTFFQRIRLKTNFFHG